MESLVLFFASSLLLALSPGPDNLYVLSQSLQYGKRAGGWVTLGLCTGLLVHTTLVALGLATVLHSSPRLFMTIKLIGASYLCYLALLSFRSAGDSLSLTTRVNKLDARRLYRRGIIMNVSNPKVSIFFLSFLPQFVQPQHGQVVMQILVLGGLFILATLLIFGIISRLAESLHGPLAGSSRLQKGLAYVSGLIFMLLALRMVITS